MRRRASQPKYTEPDIFAEEYDDIWPSQKSSSIRRYSSDVQLESGRAQTDEQWSTTAAHPRTRSAVPQRRTAGQTQSRRQVDTDAVIVSAHTVAYQPARIHWTIL